MATPDITVRDATPNDVAAIVEFNRRLAEESERKILDADTLERGIRLGMSKPALCRYFIAENAGRVVGTTMVTIELTDWRAGVLWWLQSVYVHPDARRLGVFRAIYRHIEELARAGGEVRGLRLYVRDDNDAAMRTYEAMGMSPAGYRVYESDWSEAVRPGD